MVRTVLHPQEGNGMTSGRYVARIMELRGHGIRLEPTEDSERPDRPNEVNMLGLAIALALGSAGYRHHPEPRDPELQTLDALLAGQAVMPWRPERPNESAQYLVCERSASGPPVCRVQNGEAP
jgi:hypothetical protein